MLVHVLDCATDEPGRDPLTDLDVIEAELAAYEDVPARTWPTGPGWSCSTRSTCPRRASSPSWSRRTSTARGLPVFEVSAATHEGLRELVRAGRAGRRRPRGRARRRAPRGSSGPRRPPGPTSRSSAPPDGGVPGPGREAAPLDPADRLHQRRGGRLPRRPARPARRRGGAGRGRRRAGRRGPHRRPGRRRGLRLGAHGAGGERPTAAARAAPTAAGVTRTAPAPG